ncbi:MAG TPA: histidine phosphatase family protein [Vicinamibacterales bacterium]|nr:histidine phosphatase family protein [Vicinamibacterales bacterium]
MRTLLIRHGHTDAVGARLVSRLPGSHLSTEGTSQVAALCELLRRVSIDAVYMSPLERARETAAIIARDRGLQPVVCDDVNEVDFGEWTGREFKELARDPAWRRFNEQRASATVPGGECAETVRQRVIRALTALHARHAGGTIAVVSHADVIRAAVLHCAGVSTDHWYRFEISPASVTVIDFVPERPRLVSVNETGLRLS